MANELINLANYQSKYGSGWFKTYTAENWDTTIICNAPNICAEVYVKTAAAFREASITVGCYYFDGSEWKNVWTKSLSCKGGSGYDNFRWSHNRTAESYPNQSNGNYHMWGFVIDGSNEAKNSWYGVNFWMGGMGLFTQNEYDTHFKDKEIRYCRCDEIWSISSGSTYTSLDAFIDGESPSLYRGTPITETNGKYVVHTTI